MTASLVILLWACGVVVSLFFQTKIFEKITLFLLLGNLMFSWVWAFIGCALWLDEQKDAVNPIIWRRK